MICAIVIPGLSILLLGCFNLGRYAGRLRYATSLGIRHSRILCGNGFTNAETMSDDYPRLRLYGCPWMRGGAAELAQANRAAGPNILLNEGAPQRAPGGF
jgi:hypothetical protein